MAIQINKQIRDFLIDATNSLNNPSQSRKLDQIIKLPYAK
jgi:hypothetical protein